MKQQYIGNPLKIASIMLHKAQGPGYKVEVVGSGVVG
jgi:hypothetical protein